MDAAASHHISKPLIYVAAPYRIPDPVVNTRNAVLFGQHLRERYDVVPMVPHLSLLENMLSPRSDDYWLRITMDQMRCCAGVFRMPGFSQGSDAEVTEATRLGIPVFSDETAFQLWIAGRKHG